MLKFLFLSGWLWPVAWWLAFMDIRRITMSLLFLVGKVVIVLFFLIMFLRSDKLVWGIGLLTVTSAILLDTLMSTFGWQDMLEQLGFFFYVIAGALFAGAATWLWALVRPIFRAPGQTPPGVQIPKEERRPTMDLSSLEEETAETSIDRKLLYDQMRHNLGPDDLLDLIFDLGWDENDVVNFNQDTNQLIIGIIDLADQRGQSGNLALAVERVLTPIPDESLPRLEKLGADSPKPVLRYYLIANYSSLDLEQMANELGVDWELIGGDNKKTKVRNLLLYLDRRNHLQELIDVMQSE